MEKNWLIRTKSCHILGPVSREKVLELLQNGSIKPEDEVCSGNGYWIWLRETEMVERFLRAGEKQDLNPISEAPPIFGDLPVSSTEYSDDITLFTNRPDLQALKRSGELPQGASSTMAKVADRTSEVMYAGRNAKVAPSDETEHDLSYTPPPKVAKVPEPAKPLRREYIPSPTPVTPGKQAPRRRSSDEPRPVTVLRPRGVVSDRTFMIGALLALFALAAIFYYRKRIITEFLQSAVSVILPSAIAQDDISKKKTFFLKY